SAGATPPSHHRTAAFRYPERMHRSSIRSVLHRMSAACAIAAALVLSSPHPSAKQQQPAAPATTPPAADKTLDLPALPGDAHVAQSMQLAGRTLNYTVTVGALPVNNADGKKTGDVVVTSYTMDGANRAVTFALNGGPGAASVYLNFGAIGPKRVAF